MKYLRQELKLDKNNALFQHSKQSDIFLSPNYNAKKFELTSSYLTTSRKSAIKTDNFSISTQQQLDRELLLLLDSYGE